MAAASETAVQVPLAIKPLLHPTERSRFALAIAAIAITVLTPVIVVIAVAPANVIGVIGVVLVLVGLLWFGRQILRARLLGRSLRVSADTFPELQTLMNEITARLEYDRRIEVFVIDKAGEPVSVTSYLGTRIILIEGGLVAELLKPGRRPQLTFLLGRSVAALKAKHGRLDFIVLLLAAVNALKYVSLFLLPWYRATVYSGDQIGMVCCADVGAALEATRRLLVGKEIATNLPAGNVLPQSLLVQRRLLPRLVQLTSAEPHITNRYANLICFARSQDEDAMEQHFTGADPDQWAAFDRLWQRSPHRKEGQRLRQRPESQAG